ncbi:MAG: protein TolQ [Alphaproteobacteria bacterium]
MDPSEVAVTAVEVTALNGHDMTMIGLFLQADIVVKAVMVLLVLASIWSWAVMIEKAIRFSRLKRQADKFEDSFWSGGSLDDLYEQVGASPADPMASVFASAMREWRRSASHMTSGVLHSLQDRIERVMAVTINRELDRVGKRTGFLATAGSAAPFVGLFGTVWGIMNTFTAIAEMNNTTLAVVAPGIAEALFATAMGLFVAIPAVIGYNRLSESMRRYAARLNNFSAEFAAIISRQLDAKA